MLSPKECIKNQNALDYEELTRKNTEFIKAYFANKRKTESVDTKDNRLEIKED